MVYDPPISNMKITTLLILVGLMAGCTTPQWRKDQIAGQEAARQAKIIAAQVKEQVKGITPTKR